MAGVGTNRYAYSHNDPVNKSDPNGHSDGVLEGLAKAAGVNTDGSPSGGRSFWDWLTGKGSDSDRPKNNATRLADGFSKRYSGMGPVIEALTPYGGFKDTIAGLKERDATAVGLGMAGIAGPADKAFGEVAKLLYKSKNFVKEITLSKKLHGEAAQHAEEAIAQGKPHVLTINRPNAEDNRYSAIGGLEKVPGKHLDEYPPAMFSEGGTGASVRAINPADNLSAGACIGNACRGLPDGTRIRIRVTD